MTHLTTLLALCCQLVGGNQSHAPCCCGSGCCCCSSYVTSLLLQMCVCVYACMCLCVYCRFVVVQHGLEERRTPGNTLAVQPDKPYQGLSMFGTGVWGHKEREREAGLFSLHAYARNCVQPCRLHPAAGERNVGVWLVTRAPAAGCVVDNKVNIVLLIVIVTLHLYPPMHPPTHLWLPASPTCSTPLLPSPQSVPCPSLPSLT